MASIQGRRVALLAALTALISPLAHGRETKVGKAISRAQKLAPALARRLKLEQLPPSLVSKPGLILGSAMKALGKGSKRGVSADVDELYTQVWREKPNGQGSHSLYLESRRRDFVEGSEVTLPPGGSGAGPRFSEKLGIGLSPDGQYASSGRQRAIFREGRLKEFNRARNLWRLPPGTKRPNGEVLPKGTRLVVSEADRGDDGWSRITYLLLPHVPGSRRRGTINIDKAEESYYRRLLSLFNRD